MTQGRRQLKLHQGQAWPMSLSLSCTSRHSAAVRNIFSNLNGCKYSRVDKINKIEKMWTLRKRRTIVSAIRISRSWMQGSIRPTVDRVPQQAQAVQARDGEG